MYKEIIDYDIYQWLISLKVLTQFTQVKQIGNNKYELDENTSKQFQSGKKFGELLKELLAITENYIIKINKYKDSFTKDDKIYNWSLNEKFFKIFGMPISEQTKQYFIKGDHQKVNQLLRDTLAFSLKKLQEVLLQKQQNQQQNTEITKQSEQQIQEFLSNPTNLFDYIIVTLRIQLKLQNSEQVISLLAEKNKFLSKIIILGVKLDYNPIINWLLEILSKIKQIKILLTNETKNFQHFVELMKPCILSKSYQVVQLGIKIYEQLAQSELKLMLSEWFIEQEMVAVFLSAYNKYVDLQIKITSFLPYLGERILLTLDKSNIFEYIYQMDILLPDFAINNMTYLKIWDSGLIDQLINECHHISNKIETNRTSLKFISLTTNIWLYYHSKLNQQVIGNISNILKKGVRSKNLPIQCHAINCFFKLLDFFAEEKSSNAPYIFKTLVFFLIELHENIEIRQILLLNFQQSFNKFPLIPAQLLLTPILRQIQESTDKSYILNTFDIYFFTKIIGHPQITGQLAISVFETFFKIFINDIRYSPSLLELFNQLNQFFCIDEFYLSKVTGFVHEVLSLINKQEKAVPLQGNNNFEKRQLETTKKNYYIMFIKTFANQNIDSQIIQRIVRYHQSIFALKKNNENIFYKILQYFGEPQILINKYKNLFNQVDPSNKNLIDNSSEFYGDFENGKKSAKSNLKKSIKDGNYYIKGQSEIFTDNSFQSANHQKKYFNKKSIDDTQKSQLSQISQSNNTSKNFILLNQSLIKNIETQQKIKIKEKELQDTENSLLELESNKTQTKKVRIKIQLDDNLEFGCINLSTVESFEKDHLDMVIQKFEPLIKFFYHRYGSLHTENSNINKLSFEQIDKTKNKVTIVEIKKLLYEINWMKNIKKDVFNKLIQHINLQISGRSVILFYDYSQFLQVLQMLSAFVLSNKPYELGHWNIGYQLETMLVRMFKKVRVIDPQIANIKYLFQSTDYEKIEHNQRIIKKVEINETIPESLIKQIQKPEETQMCYELISEILLQKLNVHMKEQYFSQTESIRDLTPKKEKSQISFKLITNNSQKYVSSRETFKVLKKNKNNNDVQSSMSERENINKFALSRIKILTERQQKEEQEKQLKYYLKIKDELKSNEKQLKNIKTERDLKLKEKLNRQQIILSEKYIKIQEDLENQKDQILKYKQEKKAREKLKLQKKKRPQSNSGKKLYTSEQREQQKKSIKEYVDQKKKLTQEKSKQEVKFELRQFSEEEKKQIEEYKINKKNKIIKWKEEQQKQIEEELRIKKQKDYESYKKAKQFLSEREKQRLKNQEQEFQENLQELVN